MPVIFISNYARNKANMATEGLGRRVRISRSHDRWGRCDAKIMELAPSRELVTDLKAGMTEAEYIRRFWEELDPVWDKAVAQIEPGDCLLCFCGKGKFCHRYLVADRLRKEGFTVVEI
jgi:hypothetical protein